MSTPAAARLAASASSAIVCTDVAMDYGSPREPAAALGPLSVTLEPGQAVAVLGPSGCGKSTLLKIIAGLLKPTSGSVTVGGIPITGPQTQAGMVFQSAVLLEWLTVLQNITLQAKARPIDKATARQRALALLEMVGLDPATADLHPSQLSGGMQQRVSICRALLHEPSLLLLDEPFGALDALTRDQMAVDMERIWSEQRVTTVMVTHSIDEAVLMSDRVLVMTPKPARIELDLTIDLPRPRPHDVRFSDAFNAHTREIRHAFERCGVLR